MKNQVQRGTTTKRLVDMRERPCPCNKGKYQLEKPFFRKRIGQIYKYLHSQKAYAVCSNQKLPSHKICYFLHQRIFFQQGSSKRLLNVSSQHKGVLTLRFSSEYHVNHHLWRQVTQTIVLQVQNRCNQMKSITMCVE